MSNAQSNLDAAILKFTPYLQEIQHRLFNIIIVLCGVSLLAGLHYEDILSWLMQLFDLQGVNIVLTSPYQFFSLAINTGLSIGIACTFPLFIYYLLTFLKPALKPKEYRVLLKLIPAAIILFLIGFGFGIWILQFVISLYTKTTSSLAVQNFWDIGHFLSQIIMMGSLMGIMFQLPVVMTGLIRTNLLKRAFFSQYRRFFYAAIVVFAIMMPPTDMFSDLMLAAPPLFLFEIALLLNRKY